jgi:hypothetical protein
MDNISIKNIALASILIATLVLALSYVAAGQWTLALTILALGLLWLLSEERNWTWFTSLGLVILISLAAWGIRLELAPIWMLLSTVATLIAWDLAHFSQRLSRTEPSGADLLSLQQTHFRRLLRVAGWGLFLAGSALGIEIGLTFGWALCLGLLLAISLSWVVGFIRRASE